MKSIVCLVLLLGSTLVLAQESAQTLDLANPLAGASKWACVTECEEVFNDCKSQCEDTSADAHDRHFDTPDLPVNDCIRDCETDQRLCKADC